MAEKDAPSAPKKQQVGDNLRVHGRSTSGTVCWVIGRGIVPFVQYALYKEGFAAAAIARVGLSGGVTGAATVGPGFAGLGPVPSLLVGMSSAAVLRQIYWNLSTAHYIFGPSMAIFVATFNLVVEVANTLAASYTLSHLVPAIGSATAVSWDEALGWPQWTGLGLFVVGIAMEIYSEETRKSFKKKPQNKGKVDDTGLWGVVRHPNYLGYTLWRTGVALATGCIPYAIAYGAFQVYGFTHSIPELAGQMHENYGAQWEAYEQRVRWRLIPGVY